MNKGTISFERAGTTLEASAFGNIELRLQIAGTEIVGDRLPLSIRVQKPSDVVGQYSDTGDLKVLSATQEIFDDSTLTVLVTTGFNVTKANTSRLPAFTRTEISLKPITVTILDYEKISLWENTYWSVAGNLDAEGVFGCDLGVMDFRSLTDISPSTNRN
jgi:hypothetical protein